MYKVWFREYISQFKKRLNSIYVALVKTQFYSMILEEKIEKRTCKGTRHSGCMNILLNVYRWFIAWILVYSMYCNWWPMLLVIHSTTTTKILNTWLNPWPFHVVFEKVDNRIHPRIQYKENMRPVRFAICDFYNSPRHSE